MSLHGIANTSGIEGFTFKTAVSVAPVTDWRYYDSIYTERFMSTPADNPEGYFTTSVNNVRTHLLDTLLMCFAESLHHSRLLIVAHARLG